MYKSLMQVTVVLGLSVLALLGCDDQPTTPDYQIDLTTGSQLVFEVQDNAIHPIAKRSAFPEADETIDQPIPAKRLSDDDPFSVEVDPATIPEVVPWTEAHKYVGYEITVEGKIVGTGQSSDGKVNFLNFHREWRGKFYMVLFDDLAKTLDKSVSDTFLNKTLRVKGMVEEHRGRPQIKILSMDQVQFVDKQ